MTKTGYLSSEYAHALSHVGVPIELVNSGAWLLDRPIPNTSHHDLTSPYPFLCCQRWSSLADDIPKFQHDFVSLVVVTSPFHGPSLSDLSTFDFSRPYKDHFVTYLDRPCVSSHHTRDATKALKQVEVEVCAKPTAWTRDWTNLYDNLIARHNIQGVTKFSYASLERQLAVPGAVLIRTSKENRTTCMLLWYVQDNVAYYHLGASSDEGYQLQSSYAAFWASIAFFRGQVEALSLGAGAGAECDGSDGLSRFKKGWSNGTLKTYLCGKVLNQERYEELSAGRDTDFFPAYREWVA